MYACPPVGDTVFNSSRSWCTRRCEVIRIGDRDYAGQLESSMPMRTPVSGDRALGYIVNSPGPMGSVRVFTARQVDHCAQVLKREKEKTPAFEDAPLFFHTSLRYCVDPSRKSKDTMADAMRDLYEGHQHLKCRSL